MSVYPLAGTPDASPTTQISFRGAAADDLKGIRVEGSRTGKHEGELRAHSDGKGASFVPAKPFQVGERVTVTADAKLIGATKDAVSFTIARPPGPFRPGPHFPDTGGVPPGTLTFRSNPALHPPAVKVTKHENGTAPGLLFVAPKLGPGQNGALILDDRGRTVWFHPVPEPLKVYDFRAQTYRSKPVLTWWEGIAAGGEGEGKGVIADSSYRAIATVKASAGYRADIHEFQLTPQGTALLPVYEPVYADMSPVGDTRHHAVIDSIIQEIDVKTGLVVFEWHALGHVPLTESFSHPVDSVGYDYFHVNSIEQEPNGNLLVSARNTSTVYEIERATGKILWRLGGKQSDFPRSIATNFVAQHDARRQPDGTITIFDNGDAAPPPGPRKSRAIVLNLDVKAKKVRLVHAYSAGTATFSQGSMQVLPNGNVVVGWGGGNRNFSEFSADGRLVFDARFVPKVETYRVHRLPWTGRPAGKPSVAVSGTTVYASWNGATEIATWDVLAGSDPSELKSVASAPRTGFETAIELPSATQYVAVRALDASGKALGTSRAIASS